jgi:hypothetical protein
VRITLRRPTIVEDDSVLQEERRSQVHAPPPGRSRRLRLGATRESPGSSGAGGRGPLSQTLRLKGPAPHGAAAAGARSHGSAQPWPTWTLPRRLRSGGLWRPRAPTRPRLRSRGAGSCATPDDDRAAALIEARRRSGCEARRLLVGNSAYRLGVGRGRSSGVGARTAGRRPRHVSLPSSKLIEARRSSGCEARRLLVGNSSSGRFGEGGETSATPGCLRPSSSTLGARGRSSGRERGAVSAAVDTRGERTKLGAAWSTRCGPDWGAGGPGQPGDAGGAAGPSGPGAPRAGVGKAGAGPTFHCPPPPGTVLKSKSKGLGDKTAAALPLQQLEAGFQRLNQANREMRTYESTARGRRVLQVPVLDALRDAVGDVACGLWEPDPAFRDPVTHTGRGPRRAGKD